MRRAYFPGTSTWRAILSSRSIASPATRTRHASSSRPAGTTRRPAAVTTLGEEKRINTFFRLQNPAVIARLRESFPELGEHPDARTVFVKLRELRNSW